MDLFLLLLFSLFSDLLQLSQQLSCVILITKREGGGRREGGRREGGREEGRRQRGRREGGRREGGGREGGGREEGGREGGREEGGREGGRREGGREEGGREEGGREGERERGKGTSHSTTFSVYFTFTANFYSLPVIFLLVFILVMWRGNSISKNGGTKRGRQKEKEEERGGDYRPHRPLDHRHQHWLQRKRKFVGDTHTHTHTHTHTQEGDRDHSLGGGSRRGLLELLVVGTVGASGEGEIYS